MRGAVRLIEAGDRLAAGGHCAIFGPTQSAPLGGRTASPLVSARINCRRAFIEAERCLALLDSAKETFKIERPHGQSHNPN